MVEHLIAGETLFASYRQNLVEVADVEIADAPAEDLAVSAQLFESRDRLGERMRASPMQQVAIKPVGAQACERALARGPRSRARGVLRQHFGNQKGLVAAAGDSLTNDLFRDP